MWLWLSDNFVDMFGYAVPPALVFAVLDILCNTAIKLAFFGKSNLRLGGGKFND